MIVKICQINFRIQFQALIRSPAAGLKRPEAKEMDLEIEEESAEQMDDDTSLNLGALTQSKNKVKRAKVIQEIEPDQDMMIAEEN